MASNAFGTQKRPAGKEFRDGTVGEALDEVYKDVDAGFSTIELSIPLLGGKPGYVQSVPGGGEQNSSTTLTGALATQGVIESKPTSGNITLTLPLETDLADAVIADIGRPLTPFLVFNLTITNTATTGSDTVTLADNGYISFPPAAHVTAAPGETFTVQFLCADPTVDAEQFRIVKIG